MAFAAFILPAAFSLAGDSATFDETAHIVAGYSYLDRRDFRLNPEHPPLAKIWAALPLWISGSGRIDYGSARWASADQWRLGYEFLNGPAGQPERLDPRRRLLPARLMMLAFGIALGLVVWVWSRDLWGKAGGLISLFLCAFSPTILAHTRLVTTDVAAALGFALPAWCLHRFCRSPSWRWGAALGGAMGLALVVKFSTLILVLLLPLLLLLWIIQPDEEGGLSRKRRLAWAFAALLGGGVIAVGCVWACYGFRYEASAQPGFALPWDRLEGGEGPVSRAVEVAKSARLLPEAFLYGLRAMAANTQRTVFFNGEIVQGGSWLYFPEAFLFKSTPALLALLGWALVFNFRPLRLPALEACILGIPATCYFASAMGLGMNIGHRHLAPVYPFIFVLAGGLTKDCIPLSKREVIVALLVFSHAVSSLSACPRYLSYFNILAGGPSGGWRYLGDSNIDWGQDLPRLKRWMDAHGVEEVHLAYFGTADPAAYGIRFRKVYVFPDFGGRETTSPPRSGDYLAASVNVIQGFAPLALRKLLDDVRRRTPPAGRAGDSIYIYRIP